MFLSIAKEVWDTIKCTYSNVQDASVIFDIQMKISSTRQGSLAVIEYYNKMNGYWLELNHYQDIRMKCSEDAATLTAIFERDKVVEFFAGLNFEFDQVRVQVLGREKLPSLNEVFSIVCSEEFRRIAMLNDVNPKGSVMVTNKMDGTRFKLQQGRNESTSKSQNQVGLWCLFAKNPSIPGKLVLSWMEKK